MSHLKLLLWISPSPAHKINSLALGDSRIFSNPPHNNKLYGIVYTKQISRSKTVRNTWQLPSLHFTTTVHALHGGVHL